MNNDITAQIRYEAEKRNLKESTIRAYCNGTKYFLKNNRQRHTELVDG